jgi:hypothetical protein
VSWLAESLSVLRVDARRMAATAEAAVEALLGAGPPDTGDAGGQVDAVLWEHGLLTEGEE